MIGYNRYKEQNLHERRTGRKRMLEKPKMGRKAD